MAGKSKGKASQKRATKGPKQIKKTDASVLSDQQWLHLSVACAVCSVFLYWNTLQNDFVFDDSSAVVQNPDVRGEASLGELFRNDFWATPLSDRLSHKSYRPITTLTFRITALLHGMEPMPFHLVNVILYAVACYVAVQCVKQMMQNTFSSHFPVVTCLPFAFHPIHTEVVATVVGRADLLAAIFAFTAFYSHSQSMEQCTTNQKFFYCLALAWLSSLSKETGLTILGICGAHEVARIWCKSHGQDLLKSITRFLALAAMGVAYLWFRKLINGPSTGILPSAGDNPLVMAETSLQYALTAAFIMALYIWRLVNPFTLLCDYGYNVVPLIRGISDGRNLLTLVMVVGIMLLIVVAMRKATQEDDGRMLMALAWIFVPLLPASHILMLGTVVAERFLFLPSLGYCMLVAFALESAWTKISKRTHFSVLAIVLAVFTSRILTRNQEWKTEESLWQADYASRPQNVKIAMNRASDLYRGGDYDAAWHIVKDLQRLGDVQHFELCALQAKTTALSQEAGQNFDMAYQILDDCVQQVNARSHPSQKDNLVFSQYGYLLSQEERFEEAVIWFSKASASSESAGVNAIGPVCNEGEILARLGKWAESVPVLEKCADLSTRGREWNKDTKLMNLAKAYYMTREFDAAEKVLMQDMSQTEETASFLETVRKAKKQQEDRARQQQQQQ